MGRFQYLGGIVPLMVGEYLIVAIIILWLHNRKRLVLNREREPLSLFHSFLNSKSFDDIYRSHHRAHHWDIVLLFWRLGCFLFFLIVPCIENYVDEHGFNYKWFTQWNIDWIVVYYMTALFSSIVGLYTERFGNSHSTQPSEQPLNGELSDPAPKSIEWSYPMQVIGHAAHVLFEIAGGSAFFVTVIDFSLLGGHFTFMNTSEHFVTSLSLLVEMYLNRIEVRWEHLLLNLGWALFYLIFIWPAVKLDTVKSWPYGFLDTSTPTCFAWYTFLFIVNVIFYLIWYGFYRLKLRCFPMEGATSVGGELVKRKSKNHGRDDEDNRIMNNDLELNCNEIADAHCDNHSPIGHH